MQLQSIFHNLSPAFQRCFHATFFMREFQKDHHNILILFKSSPGHGTAQNFENAAKEFADENAQIIDKIICFGTFRGK